MTCEAMADSEAGSLIDGSTYVVMARYAQSSNYEC